MHDISAYLRQHEPFTGLDPEVVGQIAERVEIEFFAAGDTIFKQGESPAERVRIVVSGAVELLDGERLLDLLGPGEMFGHPSMLAGLPTGLTVRAHEDAICYLLPTGLLMPLLSRPEGLRYVARSLLERQWQASSSQESASEPGLRAVGTLIREPTVFCQPSTSIREVAQQMSDSGASSALIKLADSQLGILTDRDLRRVVAGVINPEAPVSDVMTAPAYTSVASRLGSEVMIEMINRGIRHVPVTSPGGEVIGVVTDVDLLASDTRTPFIVRRAVDRAESIEQLIEAGRQLRPTVVALYDARLPASQLSAIIAAFADSLTRRALELLSQQFPGLPPLMWLTTGSFGREEAFPSSDIDCAIAWEGTANAGDQLRGLAEQVLRVLAQCRFATDTNSVSAAHPLFARSAAGWRAAISRWLKNPEDDRLVVVISILADRRPVHTLPGITDPFTELSEVHRHPLFLRNLRRLALVNRPPTGFLRDIVLESSGQHRGQFDIKANGFMPIVGVGRYMALAHGISETGTIPRLKAAADSGALPLEDAQVLCEAFELLSGLRMGHQMELLRRETIPNDFIDPAQLNPLTRRYLREAFRAIARMQRRLPDR
jgi:CBS domain-containing protein